MSDITVTLPKKKYDELVEFRSNIHKGCFVVSEVDFNYSQSFSPVTIYEGSKEVMDQFNKKLINKLQQDISELRAKLFKLENKWWRFWK